VTLGIARPGAEIRYTVDGTAPARTSVRYQEAITIAESVTLRMRAFVDAASSPAVSVTFRRLSDYPRITLSAPYAPQYAAAGDDTLIDGLRGNDNFKTGRWQGYRGTDLAVTLDFGVPREIRRVAMGFIQDIGSWIFMPRSVTVEASVDGLNFTVLGRTENPVPERESKATTRDFALDLREPRPARYVRLRVETFGKLPSWHPGSGEDAWFFTDEIIVR
jgi:hypothetical protein